jgi:predicted branched-subunit amino acid permease
MTEADLRTAGWWYWRGVARFGSLPALILMGAFVGFAGLARDGGLSLMQAVLLAGGVWALPSCVILVGAIQAGTPLLAAMMAVTLSAVRLMPMVMSLVPVMRGPKTRAITLYVLAHAVAVTGWVMAMTELPNIPRERRTAYFAGISTGLITGAMIVTGVSYVLVGALPPIAAAGLIFLMPLYFTISLWGAARAVGDKIAMAMGAAVWPLMVWLAPGFDLLLTGLVGGLAGYAIDRAWRQRGAA